MIRNAIPKTPLGRPQKEQRKQELIWWVFFFVHFGSTEQFNLVDFLLFRHGSARYFRIVIRV